jgi:hypothetical protein
MSPRITVVSRDPAERLAIARAFDRAPGSWRVELCRDRPVDAEVVVVGSDLGEPGEIVFDRSNPQAAIDEVNRRLCDARERVIVVTSGSGGAGATTIAAHLAQELRGCLVDLDVGRGAGWRLGLDADARTWASVDEAAESLRLSALPVAGGFRVLLAPSEASCDVSDLLARARSEFARVVVDAPRDGGLGAALARADAGVLVVPPTVPGARRAGALLEGLQELPWAVVTNRLGPGGEASRVALGRLIGHSVSIDLPCCAALRDAEDEGRLLSTGWYRWRRALRRLARALVAVEASRT